MPELHRSAKSLLLAPHSRVLSVGVKSECDALSRFIVDTVIYDSVEFAVLAEHGIAQMPDLVLSFVYNAQFDVLDLAALLHREDFSGRYRAVCAQLPSPKIVQREVSHRFPLLDFDILPVPDALQTRMA